MQQEFISMQTQSTAWNVQFTINSAKTDYPFILKQHLQRFGLQLLVPPAETLSHWKQEEQNVDIHTQCSFSQKESVQEVECFPRHNQWMKRVDLGLFYKSLNINLNMKNMILFTDMLLIVYLHIQVQWRYLRCTSQMETFISHSPIYQQPNIFFQNKRNRVIRSDFHCSTRRREIPP